MTQKSESKSEKYEELQQKFINGAITEEELEDGMDDLFDSGEEFLKYEEERSIVSDEMHVRLRGIKQIAIGIAIIASFIALNILTKGVMLVPILIVYFIVLLAYLRRMGKI